MTSTSSSMSFALLPAWRSCSTRARRVCWWRGASSRRGQRRKRFPEQAARLAGSFYNAGAVTAHALALAKTRACDIHIVCSGESDYFGLDDAVCAGYLALELQRQQAGIQLWDSASAAIALYEAFKPPRVLDFCSAARSVVEGGLPDDPPFCMRASVSDSVPVVIAREPETGLLVIEKA
jgi:2-phosphosulfolactate phosphatase